MAILYRIYYIFRSDISKETGKIFALQIGTIALTYLFHILAAKFLGKDEYGIFIYVISWLTILATPSALGFQTSTLRFFPEYIAKKNFNLLKGFIKITTRYVTFSSLLTTSSAILVLIIFFKDIKTNLFNAFLVGFLFITIIVLSNLQNSRLKANGKGVNALFYNFMRPILLIGFLLIGLLIFTKVESLLLLFIHGLVFFIILFFQNYDNKKLINYRINNFKAVYLTREWLKVSLPLLLIAEFTLLLGRIDTIMIGGLIGPGKVGIYNIAVKTANIVGLVLVAVNVVVTPKFSQLYTNKKIKELQELLTNTTFLIIIPTAVVIILILLFSNSIFGFMGNSFLEAKKPLYFLLFGQFTNAMAGSVGSLLNMTGNQYYSLIIYGFSVILNFVLNYFFITNMGMIGAAIATSITMITWNVVLSIMVYKKLKIYPSFTYSLLQLTKRN